MDFELLKTELTKLDVKDILNYINNHESTMVPYYNMLWEYYKGKNQKILARKAPDPNNPANNIPVSYARKVITTFTGYAFRPRYITYKAINDQSEELKRAEEKEIAEMKIAEENRIAAQEAIARGEMIHAMPKKKLVMPPTPEEQFLKELQQVYNDNNEHIKTSRAGRNIGIFGVSYEIVYVDGEASAAGDAIPIKAVPKFFTVDPREMILLYDYASEPRKVCAIRYYKINPLKYKVEVYYKDSIELYDRVRNDSNTEWKLVPADGRNVFPNYFKQVPVAAYYNGDEAMSIFENIIPIIDAYDVLTSDSMNEFDRFAFAYLVMKKFGLTDPTQKKDPTKPNMALLSLKRRRVFENLAPDADIKFLTKDIPTDFIKLMGDQLREMIHVQSHVPDFTSDRLAQASGIAIQRLMFDFENLVASADADFDVGLCERITLIAVVLEMLKRPSGTKAMVGISHKRNVPLNLKEMADTALVMKKAGFSRYLVADIMPDDIVTDVDEELARQDEDSEKANKLIQPPDEYNTEGVMNNREPPAKGPDEEEGNLEAEDDE